MALKDVGVWQSSASRVFEKEDTVCKSKATPPANLFLLLCSYCALNAAVLLDPSFSQYVCLCSELTLLSLEKL